MENKIECAYCQTKDKSPLCSIPQAVSEIDKIKVVTKHSSGDAIFRVGDFPLGLYSIQTGLVKIESTSPQGNNLTLRLVGPGGAIGYRSLFADEAYNATAIAVEETTLCFIPKAPLFELFRRYPEITLNLLCHVSKDLKQSDNKWVDQIEKAASGRIAESLLFLSDHFKHDHWTRREIAQWAGTTTETVIRTLAQFEKDSIISQADRHIQILNRNKLKERANNE